MWSFQNIDLQFCISPIAGRGDKGTSWATEQNTAQNSTAVKKFRGPFKGLSFSEFSLQPDILNRIWGQNSSA